MSQTSRADEVQQTLVKFIEDEILLDRGPTRLSGDEPLFSGVLDSLDALRLVAFVEEKFGIDVQDGELSAENFGSLRTLAEYVAGKADKPKGDRKRRFL